MLFKLDGGLDHILVDEAQDTSPAQWQIVKALAREFFSGAARASEVRTLFAVGDEKQSIYSFQGAEPAQFDAMGARLRRAWRARAELDWRRMPLDLSFRTVSPVLAAVDAVFADAARTPGLTARGGHRAPRRAPRRATPASSRSGRPRSWRRRADVDAWSPLDEERSARAGRRGSPTASPTTIAAGSTSGEMLASEGRPIRAGDILDPGAQARVRSPGRWWRR